MKKIILVFLLFLSICVGSFYVLKNNTTKGNKPKEIATPQTNSKKEPTSTEVRTSTEKTIEVEKKEPVSKNYVSKNQLASNQHKMVRKVINATKKGKKKTLEERAQFNEGRLLYEFYRQVNPNTGRISARDKELEREESKNVPLADDGSISRVSAPNYVNRGPGNLGGRTRSLVYDKSDPTGNTILAGAISGGVFRTTNGGTSWTKVSAQDEIHNVTTIAQDPRPGFQNIWYYGTGESLGNSASLSGAFYYGRGIWKSVDSGLSWTQITTSNSVQETFDSRFDFVHRLAVHPVTGDLYAGIAGQLARYNGTTWTAERNDTAASSSKLVDVIITSTGRVYCAFSGNSQTTIRGIWTSPTGIGAWTRIADNGTPTGWSMNTSSGRVVLGLAPSNENILYALYLKTGTTPSPGDSDLWRWNQATTTWTNFSSKIPDEPGGSAGNDPFNSQGAYDLVVNVKPDDENFVVIGGTNAYKISNINTGSFVRIGGYGNPNNYAQWNVGGVTHHPDVHTLVFNPITTSILLSGTDGGIHQTNDINASSVSWVNLNNKYQTYQYYHVNMDPQSASDGVIGGAQDNGTTAGGTIFGLTNLTNMTSVFSGDGVAAAISRDNACVPFFMGSQGGNLYRDCPTGAIITPTGSVSEFVTYFHLDPDNNSNLYYAGRDVLWKTNSSSTVTAGTWTNMGATSLKGHTDYFQTFSTTRGTYNASTSYLLLGGDEGHIYRLNDPRNATSFSAAVEITPPGATIGFPSIVTGLAIHPTNRNIVLATYSNYGTQSIFYTTNATAATPTWTLVERNLASHSIRSAAITQVNGQTLFYVGTARGLYSTTDPTTTDWVRQGANEIGYALVSSLAYRHADGTLLIGTHGNGMYQSKITLCDGITTTWNGSSWSNGVPTATREAIFTGNFSSTANLEACTVTITNNATVTFNSGHTFIIGGGLTVDTGANLVIENNAALRQINKDDNSGSIVVKRTSSPMIRQDYTAWSSPVANQQLLDFSPNTIPTRFYEYLYTGTTTPTAYQSVDPSTNFQKGKGYMIRVDNNWSSTVPSAYNGQFEGVPFNGDVAQRVGKGFNVLGNPYASPISADTFLDDNLNASTLYFWTNTTPATGGSYPQNNFASYTKLGGVAAFGSAKIPNGTIQTGQGFYVQSTAYQDCFFKNTQRVNASVSTQFFKFNQTPSEKHLFRLNFNDENVSYNQFLIGYTDGATDGFDNLIDGKMIDTSKPSMYSIIDETEYVIQGKGLPFNDEDIIPLGYKVINEGNYSISIENVEGLFDTQDIFIKDKLSNIVTDIKNNTYHFYSNAGTFEDRFEIVYRNTLLSNDSITATNAITIFSDNVGINVNSNEKIKEITIYDVVGKTLYQNQNVNATTFVVNSLPKNAQVVLVKVTDYQNQVTTQKIVF